MKKFSTIFLIVAVAGCLLSSCSKKVYYQVYQTLPVNADNCQMKHGYLTHEDANCIVRHSFFAQEGDAGFWVTNKTDSIIYVDLAECFFTLNGTAYDYYQSREWTQTKSQTVSSSKREKGKKSTDISSSASSTSTKATSSVERRVVVVPPHATKYVSEYHIVTSMMELCGVTDTPRRGKSAGTSFTAETSPVTFGNYITYKVGMHGKKVHVDDQFYVSQIINVNGGSMFEMVREKDACGKEKGEKVEKMLYSTADRFYVSYKR
jgi:hypothetical protein